MYEVYEDSRYIYIVMDHLTGGELFDRIIEIGCYNEIDAAELMKQIILAVSYLHT